ncbi:hypothetical protein ALC60_01025 [Trachymyrmex zeteki]|uniref:Transmembrane protein 9 n=1 Tax=Mycetomoellerius zeteki TaxID=64791 RepID=A0A151XHP9_9HYME|nr:hypothetical protein ALC60_01025 [Trachymyrmex zeteki]
MLKYIFPVAIIVIACLSQRSEAQYDDKRCKCICPSLSSVINTTQSTERLTYIINVPPLQCKCESVVLPKLGDQIKGKIVVIIVIWVISLLVIYMLFLICLDPLLNKRIHKASANIGYHEHNNEEVNISILFFSLTVCKINVTFNMIFCKFKQIVLTFCPKTSSHKLYPLYKIKLTNNKQLLYSNMVCSPPNRLNFVQNR